MSEDLLGSFAVIPIRTPSPAYEIGERAEGQEGGKQSVTHATGLMTGSSTPLGEDVAPSDAAAMSDGFVTVG